MLFRGWTHIFQICVDDLQSSHIGIGWENWIRRNAACQTYFRFVCFFSPVFFKSLLKQNRNEQMTLTRVYWLNFSRVLLSCRWRRDGVRSSSRACLGRVIASSGPHVALHHVTRADWRSQGERGLYFPPLFTVQYPLNNAFSVGQRSRGSKVNKCQIWK